MRIYTVIEIIVLKIHNVLSFEPLGQGYVCNLKKKKSEVLSAFSDWVGGFFTKNASPQNLKSMFTS